MTGTLVKGVFTEVLFSLMSFTIDNVIIAMEKPHNSSTHVFIVVCIVVFLLLKEKFIFHDIRKWDSGKPLLQSLEIESPKFQIQ